MYTTEIVIAFMVGFVSAVVSFAAIQYVMITYFERKDKK